MTVSAIGTKGHKQPLGPLTIPRREIGPKDVRIDIAFCGVCHSDLHTARAEWGEPKYPCVPGHEIVGKVSAVGAEVTKFKAGDIVGVGCLVDSCGHCDSCGEGLEQYCENGFTGTYDAPSKDEPGHTLGGYSQAIVVSDRFVVKVTHPEEQLAAVAPLLCAGITTWSPLRHWQAGPGKKVGIVGIGGLGHMGLKLSHALGAETVALTTSPDKAAEARRLGADDVVVTKDAEQMAAHAGSFDLIINTVSASLELTDYTNLLKRDGTMVLLGVPEHPHAGLQSMPLIFGRKAIAGSLIGGLPETQEMLDFCAEHGIVSDIELIAGKDIETAYERMLKSDVRYRFVIDSATLSEA